MSALVEEIVDIDIQHIPTSLECLSSRDSQDMLLQWNLHISLKVEKFRFTGISASSNQSDYDRVLNAFFKSSDVMKVLGITGSIDNNNDNNNMNNNIKHEQLSTSVMTMEFFDRLYNDICPNGYIRGCFEETYDGIIIQDKLREVMLNPDSENSCLYNDKDRNQYIYNLFKLFVIGGSLCQPETKIDRYLSMTKGLYKDTLTVYKQSKNDEITTAGKVFSIKEVAGLTLFNDVNSPHNILYLVVDPMKKNITAIKFDYKSFW